MSQHLKSYIDQVTKELVSAKNSKASIERKILSLETILGNAEYCFQKELKKNSIRVRRLKGEKTHFANQTTFKKKSESNVPSNEPENSVAGVPDEAVGEVEDAPKKSGWSLFS